jgi:hypothetical protein
MMAAVPISEVDLLDIPGGYDCPLLEKRIYQLRGVEPGKANYVRQELERITARMRLSPEIGQCDCGTDLIVTGEFALDGSES